MKIVAWRIYKSKYAGRAFTGDGARAFGGRFNSKGTCVVYLAGTMSLAVLEMLVHLQRDQLLASYRRCSAAFEEGLVRTVHAGSLPDGWRDSPPSALSQVIGDEWVAAGSSAVLRVPSALIESEWIYMLNPNHRDFRHIEIGREHHFQFPPRLASRT